MRAVAQPTPKERPILFSAPMIRALLQGEKTQTRRVVRMPADSGERVTVDPGGTIFGPGPYLKVERTDGVAAVHPRLFCPYGHAGDRLWVRETHAQFAVGNRTGSSPQCVAYRATCDGDSFTYVNNGDEIMQLTVTKWTPSIYMPRWASRITLAITGVRVERLHDIDELGALAEGVEGQSVEGVLNGVRGEYIVGSARDAFAELWAKINGAESWAANPWVWVVEFTRVDDPAARTVAP